MAGKRILIIGGSAVGPKTAARARRRNPEAEITILEQGKTISYAACGIPFYLSGEVTDLNKLVSTPLGVVRDATFFRAVKNIDVQTGMRATRIDRKNNVVEAKEIDTGKTLSFPYDNLVLALGATPLVPPIDGMDLQGVFKCRTLEDASYIMQGIEESKEKAAVIVGGGLISLELAEAFSKKGMTVSLVEIKDHLAPMILDPEMSTLIEQYLSTQKVRFYLQEKVVQLKGNGGHVGKVITDKRELPADVVVIATGIRPTTQLARDAGLTIGASGGIGVNEFLQTSDPAIYAGGDCVESFDLIGRQKVLWPMGSLANKHGRVIGDNITGAETTFPGVVRTAVAKVFEFNIGRAGLGEEEARRMGYELEIALAPAPDKPYYYPTAKHLTLKLIADKKSRRLLGVQGVGRGEVSKRIDVAATALMFGATVDQVADLDLGYAPPYSSALDNIIEAANIVRNKIDGLAEGIPPAALKDKVDKGEEFILLDCRTPKELERARLDVPGLVTIPLGKLRERLNELDRGKETITLCKIGLRSYEAYRILKGAGFKNVRFMDGGLDMWTYEKN